MRLLLLQPWSYFPPKKRQSIGSEWILLLSDNTIKLNSNLFYLDTVLVQVVVQRTAEVEHPPPLESTNYNYIGRHYYYKSHGTRHH